MKIERKTFWYFCCSYNYAYISYLSRLVPSFNVILGIFIYKNCTFQHIFEAQSHPVCISTPILLTVCYNSTTGQVAFKASIVHEHILLSELTGTKPTIESSAIN